MAPVAPPALHDTPPRAVEDAVIEEARRRARRRRIRQGIVVAVVAAVAAAVVAALGSRQSQPPQGGGDSPAAAQDSGVGLTDVSDPSQLLASYGAVHVGWVLVYVDGRVLWYPDHDPVFERRLTPRGVALIRAGSLDPGDLKGTFDLTAPAGVWVEPEWHEYRASAYAVCLWAGVNQPGEVRALPAAAREVLSDAPPARAGHVVAESYEASAWNCLRLDRADLAALERTAARVNRWGSGDEIVFPRSRHGSTLTAFVSPIMPHGEWIAWGG